MTLMNTGRNCIEIIVEPVRLLRQGCETLRLYMNPTKRDHLNKIRAQIKTLSQAEKDFPDLFNSQDSSQQLVKDSNQLYITSQKVQGAIFQLTQESKYSKMPFQELVGAVTQ